MGVHLQLRRVFLVACCLFVLLSAANGEGDTTKAGGSTTPLPSTGSGTPGLSTAAPTTPNDATAGTTAAPKR